MRSARLPRGGARSGFANLIVAIAAAGFMAAGCSGGSTPPAHSLLESAKQSLNATRGVHFTLTSANVPHSGTVLVGGSGDAIRPALFKGTLRVAQSGLQLSVGVISAGGKVYLKPPLVPGYTQADPHRYGFSDPGLLLNPRTGLASLVDAVTSAKSAGKDRFNGATLDEVAVTIPGTAVAHVLTSKDPSKPVTGRLGIDPSTHELRRAVLTGPFLAPDMATTFTVVLDHYGETVNISAPG
jgi:lipoprotein LprG